MSGLPLQNYTFTSRGSIIISRLFSDNNIKEKNNYNQFQISKSGKTFDSSYITKYKQLRALQRK